MLKSLMPKMRIKVLVVMMLALITQSAIAQKKWVVAQDGSGDFTTVQAAINAVPNSNLNATVIYIKKGIYKEKLTLAASKWHVKFVGESLLETVLTYDDFAQKKDEAGKEIGTSGSSSFFIFGRDFTAENITFQNSAGPVGQAVAVRTGGDRAFFKNCRFLGFQDTLYTYLAGGKQYYLDCYIEGTTDFIFGSATAVFKNCEIFCKKVNSYITAASTPETSAFGYVFLNCKITGEAEPNSYFLGRPWRPYAKTVFIKCWLGNHIKPEGWNNWGKTTNEQTTFYAEYKNTGPGFKTSERVGWSHQLSAIQAKAYTLKNIFGDWRPK